MIRQVMLSTKQNGRQLPHSALLNTTCKQIATIISSSTSSLLPTPSASSQKNNHSYHTHTITSSSQWKNHIIDKSNGNNKYRHFSSMPPMTKSEDGSSKEEDVLTLPPNLKFDPRAISTPIYGLTQIGQDATDNDIDIDNNDDDDDDATEATSEDTNDIQIDNDVDDEYEMEEPTIQSYSLTNQPEPKYVQPLPDRLHIPIIDLMTSNPIGTIHLSPYVFGNDPIRTDILHRCVIYQRNKKRGLRNNGARTKTISEISGSGNKVRAQKGGGIARAGHKRPPHWRGGAKAHGPKGMVQNYETKLNKKVRMMGVRMALSQKLKEGNVILVNTFEGLGTYKTKVLANVLDDLGDISGRYGCTALVVDHVPEEESEEEDGTLRAVAGVDINLHVASGNLFKVKVRNQKFVNVYDLLKYEKLVLSLSALEALEGRYGEN